MVIYNKQFTEQEFAVRTATLKSCSRALLRSLWNHSNLEISFHITFESAQCGLRRLAWLVLGTTDSGQNAIGNSPKPDKYRNICELYQSHRAYGGIHERCQLRLDD